MNEKKGTILVVDDNELNQHVAARMIRILAYEYEGAANGREGLEAFLRKPDYCAILMDCLMPEMDGFEATAEIRKREVGHVPIIAITANNKTIGSDQCFKAGMDRFMIKPIQLDILRDELDQLIRAFGRKP